MASYSVLTPQQFLLTRAQGFAAACSLEKIAPCIKKEGRVYSLAGAPDAIRALSDKCSALFRLSEAEMWQKLYGFRPESDATRWKALTPDFAKMIDDDSKENVLHTCIVLKACLELERSQRGKEILKSSLDSITPLLH